MSLNGLDSAAVLEAYNTAMIEPGGWFLLKYTARDSVELLARGKNGVHEARLAIARYEDPSPLYGILIYRRRKVLIKYIPEGTSRLLQARTAVHFQDVTERYSPYETLLEIPTADALNDTSLAASFPLHTASPSASSSRLHEISEDGEDMGPTPRRTAMQGLNNGTIFGTRQYKMERRVEQIMRPDRGPPSIQISPDNSSSVSSQKSPGKAPISSQFLVRDDPAGKRSITSLGSPLAESFSTDYAASSNASDRSTTPKEVDNRPSQTPETPTELAPQPSPSEQAPSPSDEIEHEIVTPPITSEKSTASPPSSRPTTSATTSAQRPKQDLDSEPFDFSYLDAKPKVKLAPRPVAADEHSRRPTASSVSSLPSAYRSTPKRQEFQSPPRQVMTLQPAKPLPLLPVPPIPDAPEYSPRPVSRGSVKSLPSHKSSAMTPDKLRLMKAVELRKKQLRKSNPQLPTTIPAAAAEVPSVPQIPESVKKTPSHEQESTVTEKPQILALVGDKLSLVNNKADSGIDMAYQRSESRAEKLVEEPKEEQRKLETQPDTGKDTAPAEQAHATSASNHIPPFVDAATVSTIPREESSDDAPHNTSTASHNETRPQNDPPRANSPTNSQTHDDSSPSLDFHEPLTRVPTIVMSPDSPQPSIRRQQEEGSADTSGETTDETEQSEADLADHSPPQSPRKQNKSLAKRRRGIVEPLNLDAEAELLADEDFMDELQDAIVHEAKPLQVARSPVATYFPRHPSNPNLASVKSNQQPATLDNQIGHYRPEKDYSTLLKLDKEGTSSAPGTGQRSMRRSVSPLLDGQDPASGLRRNVSTGISKRIQALTELSQRDNRDASHISVSPSSSVDGSPNDRKLRSPTRSRPGSVRGRWALNERSNSYNTTPPPPSESVAIWNVSQDGHSNRDSINVRARIVRPPSGLDNRPESSSPDEAGKLHESKIEISHNIAAPPSSRLLPPLNTTTIPKRNDGNNLTTSPIRFRGRKNGPTSPISAHPDDFPVPPTYRPIGPFSSIDESKDANSGSRASRFFKRMSNFGGNKRRSGTAPSLTSLSSPATADGNASIASLHKTPSADNDRPDVPPPVAVGDLNVQFPDTLLWKRRWLALDEQGNLLFSIPQSGMDYQRGTPSRKFHLSDFKIPCAPDLDRQELPHSICLDFVNHGGSLQLACEDTMVQRQVLSLLRTHWNSWAG